jgi:hypothetical protein
MPNRFSQINLRSAAGVAFACTWAAVASTSAQVQTPAAEKTTITGCVERADQVISRETLGTTVDSQTFVLIRDDAAAKPPADSGQPVGTAGASAEAARPRTMFRLEGSEAPLNEHVGHMVELSGRLTPAAQQPSVANPKLGGTVQVESMRMVAETCKR